MKLYYVRLTIINHIIGTLAKGMIKFNRYEKSIDGKYYKNISIKCNSSSDDKAINQIVNRFSKVAATNRIQFRIEVYNDNNLSIKIGQRLTKKFR